MKKSSKLLEVEIDKYLSIHSGKQVDDAVGPVGRDITRPTRPTGNGKRTAR